GTFFGFAEIVSANLPNANQNPNFTNYQYPDTFQSIVSSWACLPSVLTIGNYNNRNTYFDVDSVLQTLPEISGKIANSSSQGPTRNGLLRSEEHTSELQSRENLVCRLLLEKKNTRH